MWAFCGTVEVRWWGGRGAGAGVCEVPRVRVVHVPAVRRDFQHFRLRTSGGGRREGAAGARVRCESQSGAGRKGFQGFEEGCGVAALS